MGQLILFGPVEETSRDPLCPISDGVHSAAARGTIDSSIAKRFMFPFRGRLLPSPVNGQPIVQQLVIFGFGPRSMDVSVVVRPVELPE
jgi:hypothetical protein